MLFKKLLTQSDDQTDIFWTFLSPADTLWLPKTIRRVLGYTTVVKKAYFPSNTLNWQVLWGKEKHLLNSLYEKLKNKKGIFKTSINCKEFVSSKGKEIN